MGQEARQGDQEGEGRAPSQRRGRQFKEAIRS